MCGAIYMCVLLQTNKSLSFYVRTYDSTCIIGERAKQVRLSLLRMENCDTYIRTYIYINRYMRPQNVAQAHNYVKWAELSPCH